MPARRGTILEANLSQTIGSASTALATGTIFTIPALYLWNMAPPYLQVVEDNIIGELTAELAQSSAYAVRRAAVDAFNAGNTTLKRGLALTPVKFGISFNNVPLNQAGALVHVYNDGTVLVNHGGTEMGQGLNTKVAMVVAHELGVSLDRVRVTATDTEKVANTLPGLGSKRAREAAKRFGSQCVVVAIDAKSTGGGAPSSRPQTSRKYTD